MPGRLPGHKGHLLLLLTSLLLLLLCLLRECGAVDDLRQPTDKILFLEKSERLIAGSVHPAVRHWLARPLRCPPAAGSARELGWLFPSQSRYP